MVILFLLLVLVILNIILIQYKKSLLINLKNLQKLKIISFYSYCLAIAVLIIVGFISIKKLSSQFDFSITLLKYLLGILICIYLKSSLKELYRKSSQELEIFNNRLLKVE